MKKVSVIVGVSLILIIAGLFSAGGSQAAEPPPADGVALEMSEVAELHLRLAYKATTEQNMEEATYHIEKALALVTDPEHQSLLDGLLKEHLPEGHFVHAEGTIKEILGDGDEHMEFRVAVRSRPVAWSLVIVLVALTAGVAGAVAVRKTVKREW